MRFFTPARIAALLRATNPESLPNPDRSLRFARNEFQRMSHPPPLAAEPPSSLPPPQPNSLPKTLAILLSLYLGLFLADAVVSLVNDSLAIIFKVQLLGAIRGLLAFVVILASIGVYGLMGLTPMIPKRLFLPLVLFTPVALLATVPVMIYHYGALPLFAGAVSLGQLGLGLIVLHRAQGSFRLHWPLLREERINSQRFSWPNLLGFLGINFLVLLPVTVVYLLLGTSVAIDHYSAGFVALRSHGLTVQARKYVRADGKTVQLFPMAHVAERSFYQTLADSFTSNSIALMEGVTDEQGLLTNHISYQRAAESLGVAEQQKEFKPTQGELVPADVDIADFTTNTIGFLNLTMLVHARGLKPEILLQLMQFTPTPGFEQELLDDLVHKRNRHVVEELRSRLAESEQFVVPWGAAHMPGIAEEIQKLGFRLDETRDFTVLRFRAGKSQTKDSEPAR